MGPSAEAGCYIMQHFFLPILGFSRFSLCFPIGPAKEIIYVAIYGRMWLCMLIYILKNIYIIYIYIYILYVCMLMFDVVIVLYIFPIASSAARAASLACACKRPRKATSASRALLALRGQQAVPFGANREHI